VAKNRRTQAERMEKEMRRSEVTETGFAVMVETVRKGEDFEQSG
jgi:hypothetical protein